MTNIASSQKRGPLQLLSEYGPYIALLLLLLVCMVSSPSFRKPQNLLNITRQISYSGIIAIGMTCVIIGGGIDLSVGSMLAFCGCIGIYVPHAVCYIVREDIYYKLRDNMNRTAHGRESRKYHFFQP